MRLEHWIYTVPLRLRSLFRRSQVERELDEELQYHLEQQTEANIAGGLTPEEARFAALRAMNGFEQRKEQCRDARGVNCIDDFARDFRYAVRMLRRSPGFTTVIVLSLALGIGANTAIFSVIDGLMLRMLPVRDPQRLVRVQGHVYSEFLRTTLTFEGFPKSVFEYFRDHNSVFADTCAFIHLDRPEVSLAGQVEPAGEAQLVSGNFFSVLGVEAAFGRTIVPQDDETDTASTVTVISYGYWKRRFAMDPAVIGKTVVVNNIALEIVGVAPPKFFGISPDRAPDLWMPLAIRGLLTADSMGNPSAELVRLMARLKPEVALPTAQADLNVLYSHIPPEMHFRKGNSHTAVIEALPGGHGYSTLREQFVQPLMILMIVVSLVLLTACANVASLLLARGTARRVEISTRLALGAGRGRLVRQLLTESLLLAAAGGGAALALASWGNWGLLSLLEAGPAPLALHLDARILGFNGLVSLLTGVIFGLAPALRVTRISPAADMARLGSQTRSGLRLNKLLVVFQVSLSLLLLVAAGLFVGTLEKLKKVELGFNPEHLVQISLDTRAAGYRGPQVAELHGQLLERLGTIPGVRSVSGIRNGLIQNATTSTSIFVPGFPAPPPDEEGTVDSADVGPRFFETVGIPLLAGREFSLADNAQSHKVVIVNEALARRYFPGQNPIGRRLGTGPDLAYEIVGMANDARVVSLRRAIGPTMYFPALQRNLDRLSAIEIRTTGDPSSVISASRKQVQSVNRRLLLNIKTLPQQIDDTLLQERMIGKLSGLFGLLTLLLAAGGLYGLMAYSVARRTGEIGIRMALGAERVAVFRMVLRETLVLVACGMAVGIPAAWGTARLAGRWIDGILFEMKATDMTTLIAASLLMALVALLAGYLPARRASRLEPIAALRYE